MKMLLLIDLSNDFIRLEGSLNCGEAGLAILPYCRQQVKNFLTHGQLVVDARDNHDPEDWEISSGLFPPHNLRGTWGQELVEEISSLHEMAKQGQWLTLSKKQYNATSGTNLLSILEEYEVDEIHLVGVCTDICVRYTLNGLYEWKTAQSRNLRLVVHQQGVASFNEVGHLDSLRHFPATFGAEVV
ncbi:cysteine hydrolase family protein [Alicyclobacillus tolerans]|uniref:Nicotinamidase-related amidase n=1 Tax=Alicyclobacillus tolerans TaxID=90970 RepID=A0ABT9LY45_9BACL|nr:isochorismatase family cysteine hydrolase [Alicyclobacillus tengchongensis]MDP9729188.1 nicotinamidase-related amidase [Alicyclobacillus tengchongensis]